MDVLRVPRNDRPVDLPPISVRARALDEGTSEAQWRQATRTLSRVAAGAYAATAGLTPEGVHLVRAEAVMARLRSVGASHVTAAALWRLPVLESHLRLVHLSPTTERRGRPKSADGYHLHSRPVPPDRWATRPGLLVTDPVLTVLDSARLLEADWGVVIADAALHRGDVTAAQIAEASAAIRRQPGAGRARRLPRVISGLAESPGESLLRLRLVRMGLAPVEQVTIGEFRVDFLIDGCLIVEFDGQGKYRLAADPAAAHWAEKRRNDVLTELGHDLVHVTWGDLWEERALEARIRRAHQRAQVRRGRR